MATNPRGFVTPEAVVLDFETAGVASRAIARLIDAIIQVASLFALGAALSLALGSSVGIVMAIIGVAAIVIGYPILCEVLMHGGSPGKAVFGLRVVTVEGAPSAPWHAFIRSVVGIVDFLLPPGGLWAVTSALLTEKGQRLGDLAAGTIVLRERNAAAPAMAIWFRPPGGLEAYARTLDVTSVTDAQFAVVRSFLLRVQDLSPEARGALALRLARPIADAMHHQAPPNVHPESFLVCVAAAYQQRRAASAPSPVPTMPLPPPPPPPPPAPRPLVAPIAEDGGRYAPPSDMDRPWHYLDHAATTPLRPEALAAMVPALRDGVGNPSGAHALARRARTELDGAREHLAELVGCAPGEVVFTSGGTEADNLAIRGVLGARPGTVVCSAIEHHAVLDPVTRAGGRVAAVDGRGVVDLDALASLLDESVTLVSVMLVNNETGTIQPLDAIAAVVRERAPGALLHTDAAQALCWLDVRDAAAPADLVTLASHKCGGPVGTGALVVRAGVALEPQQVGGGQERERRSGTQDVAGALGFAAAAAAADAERDALTARATRWRDDLLVALVADVPDVVVSAAPPGVGHDHLVGGVANVCVPGVDSEALLYLLEHEHGVLASAASSCASGAQEPSHVLAALGLDRSLAAGSLRLSLGWSTTEADVAAAMVGVPAAARRLLLHARDGAPA